MASRRLRPLLPVIIALLLASVARAGTEPDENSRFFRVRVSLPE